MSVELFLVKKRLCLGVLLAFVSACSGTTKPDIAQRIAGLPIAQQRIVNRLELGLRWPLVVGTGTLGCLSGAVVFKTDDIVYAVDDAATARGFAAIQPIRQTQSAPPSHPLGRVQQEERMKIFAEAMTCGHASAGDLIAVDNCRHQVRITTALRGS